MVAAARAPLVIRHGDAKIYVYDVETLPAVLACTSPSRPSNSTSVASSGPVEVLLPDLLVHPVCVGDVATTVAQLLEVFSVEGKQPFHSLHSALGKFRKQLPAALTKRVRNLNTAYAFLRHTSTVQLQSLLSEVSAAMSGPHLQDDEDETASTACISSTSDCPPAPSGALIADSFVAYDLNANLHDTACQTEEHIDAEKTIADCSPPDGVSGGHGHLPLIDLQADRCDIDHENYIRHAGATVACLSLFADAAAMFLCYVNGDRCDASDMCLHLALSVDSIDEDTIIMISSVTQELGIAQILDAFPESVLEQACDILNDRCCHTAS